MLLPASSLKLTSAARQSFSAEVRGDASETCCHRGAGKKLAPGPGQAGGDHSARVDFGAVQKCTNVVDFEHGRKVSITRRNRRRYSREGASLIAPIAEKEKHLPQVKVNIFISRCSKNVL